MFEKASRIKLRFPVSKGFVSVEELWDLSLTSLDTIARSVNKELQAEGEQSFLPNASSNSKKSTELRLQLDLLKYVINTKSAEDTARKNRVEKANMVARLNELAQARADEALGSKSLEEINALIEQYESQLV